MADFYDACTSGGADAVLAASLFHFGEVNISHLKRYLALRGLPMRELPGSGDLFSTWGQPYTLKQKPEKAVGEIWRSLSPAQNGLVPVIVQDFRSGAVLMQAWQNEEALQQTLTTGLMYYYSRSRSRLWQKGETSGNFQQVQQAFADCDADCLLFKVRQLGPACHTGNQSCFFRELESINQSSVIE